MLKLYWQVGTMLPLFQMAQGIWPFHDLSAVKRWPLCTASQSQCVCVRVFRQGTDLAFSKSLVNSEIVGKKRQFYFTLRYDLTSTRSYHIPRVWFVWRQFGVSRSSWLESHKKKREEWFRDKFTPSHLALTGAATESLVNKGNSIQTPT